MKIQNPDLERCIDRLNSNTAQGIIDPSIEAYAVNNLRSKSDILKFRSKYIDCMTQFIESKVQKNDVKDHAVQLVNRGYAIRQVATFFVHDGLMHTLGHMFNQKTLDAWYGSLPYMKKEFPKDMYVKN
jgi:hypothetical protein